MAYAFRRWVRSIKQLNRWWVMSIVMFIFCLCTVWYYWRMLLEKWKVGEVIEQKEKELIDVKSLLRKEKNDDDYKKYQAAKLVMGQEWQMNRNENIEYLVDLLDELTDLDSNDNSILLENFQITDDSINLKGWVSSITTIYKEWWVIDMFESFEFINKISIPYYRRNDETEEIDFVLDATIQKYDWS